MKKIPYLAFIFLVTLISATWIGCGDDMAGQDTSADQFDRSLMLTHWADGFIIPGYKSYLESIDSLQSKSNRFAASPNTSRLNDLRNAYRFAYSAWQEVSMFEIGKAEELLLRNNTNIYPTNTAEILDNISTQTYNLELPSTNDQQGFPAVEYLIFGIADTDQLIVDQFLGDPNYIVYLTDLTTRLASLTRAVYTDWTNGYRETFINDDGSSASSSVNRMVNDYLFYYERFLRAGKIGIPAGYFSGLPLANLVEAQYTTPFPINRSLYLSSFDSFKNFFRGTSKYIGNGPSLEAYLDYIKDLTDGVDISQAINEAMDNVDLLSVELNNDLKMQVLDDHSKMLETFDALQVITVLLKADMLSALNISVDYVDADGD